MTAREFWKSKFDEYPQNDAEKLAVAMMAEYAEYRLQEFDEPYFGWCDVEGCENEGANGGGCWRETGYWTVCSKHSQMHRDGHPQPNMKQEAIEKEKSRDPETGYLPVP